MTCHRLIIASFAMFSIIHSRCHAYIISLKDDFVVGFNNQLKTAIACFVNISNHLISFFVNYLFFNKCNTTTNKIGK
jgi:hypothetical protein